MGALANFDLLSVGVAIAGTLVLGFVIYFTDQKSGTNRIFFAFAFVTAIWGLLNYLSYRVEDLSVAFALLRFELALAVWQTFIIFRLLLIFPDRDDVLPRRYLLALVVYAGVVSVLCLTPFVFERITTVTATGYIKDIAVGPAIALFGVTSIGFVLAGWIVCARKTFRLRGAQRAQTGFFLLGAIAMFLPIIILNFIFPAFLRDSRFVPYGAVSIFPFVLFTSYAILRFHLFNIKVITTSILVFVLSIVSFGQILFSGTLPAMLFQASVFMLVLVFGINLIRNVIREVEQREKIQKLAKELEETNKRQETLIHFIGHEVKGFLTKAEGAFASLTDGDFGQLPEELKPFVERSFAETRQGVGSVEDILKASNIKKGTVAYAKEPFDLKALVTEAVEKAKMAAAQKGLALTLVADDASYQMTGDRAQINDHVLRNLIDNAINYTPSGSIVVSLAHENGKVVFAVKDSGIGITDEDKQRLFTEGGHGKDSQTINVHSTGYGLYIAKQITEAMGGTIRAESEGAGRGSTFIAEFPAG